MMLNSYIAWNMAAHTHQRLSRPHLERHEYYTYIAERLLTYVEPAKAPQKALTTKAIMEEGHFPFLYKASGSRHRCKICRLEYNWLPNLGQSGIYSGLAQCSKCGIIAHNVVPIDSNRQIHQIPEFQNMTCFEIYHSPECSGMWNSGNCYGTILNYKHLMV